MGLQGSEAPQDITIRGCKVFLLLIRLDDGTDGDRWYLITADCPVHCRKSPRGKRVNRFRRMRWLTTCSNLELQLTLARLRHHLQVVARPPRNLQLVRLFHHHSWVLRIFRAQS